MVAKPSTSLIAHVSCFLFRVSVPPSRKPLLASATVSIVPSGPSEAKSGKDTLAERNFPYTTSVSFPLCSVSHFAIAPNPARLNALYRLIE
jgi:hypothetical protein